MVGAVLYIDSLFAIGCSKEFIYQEAIRCRDRIAGDVFSMFLNLFRLKGANEKFIHTEHGVE